MVNLCSLSKGSGAKGCSKLLQSTFSVLYDIESWIYSGPLIKIISGSLDEDRIIFSVTYVSCAGLVDLHTYKWAFTSVLQFCHPDALEYTLTSWVTSSSVIWLSPWSSWVRVLTDRRRIKETVSGPEICALKHFSKCCIHLRNCSPRITQLAAVPDDVGGCFPLLGQQLWVVHHFLQEGNHLCL